MQSECRVVVQVPEGIGPGDSMVVLRHDGQKNMVVVPEGHYAGSTFLMDFNETPPQAPSIPQFSEAQFSDSEPVEAQQFSDAPQAPSIHDQLVSQNESQSNVSYDFPGFTPTAVDSASTRHRSEMDVVGVPPSIQAANSNAGQLGSEYQRQSAPVSIDPSNRAEQPAEPQRHSAPSFSNPAGYASSAPSCTMDPAGYAASSPSFSMDPTGYAASSPSCSLPPRDAPLAEPIMGSFPPEPRNELAVDYLGPIPIDPQQTSNPYRHSEPFQQPQRQSSPEQLDARQEPFQPQRHSAPEQLGQREEPFQQPQRQSSPEQVDTRQEPFQQQQRHAAPEQLGQREEPFPQPQRQSAPAFAEPQRHAAPEQLDSYRSDEVVEGVCPLDFMTADDEPGKPITENELIRDEIYFDPQPPGSDICAQLALNHLFQRTAVSLNDLTLAEKSASKNRQGGCFATEDSQTVSGFFDIEAVKMVCTQQNCELYDVAPQPEWEGSLFQKLADACEDRWLFGFLVYDARPGRALHYAAIVRASSNRWYKLDSVERYDSKEVKNRVLTYRELAHYYNLQGDYFRSWLMRWYPLIDVDKCVKLVADVGAWAAAGILRKSQWLPDVARGELRKLVGELRRECMALHLDISHDETRKALEGDASQEEAVAHLISHLQNLPPPPEISENDLLALLAQVQFDVPHAALVLKLAESVRVSYSTIYEALKLTSYNTHQARILLEVCPSDYARACEELHKVHFDKELYMRVRVVMAEWSALPVEVAVEALRQNSNDTHAAIELLKEFRKRVVQAVEKHDRFSHRNCEMVANFAIDEKRWNPPLVFARAQQLSEQITDTLSRVTREHTVETVFSMLLLEGSPEAAAAALCGEQGQALYTAPPERQTQGNQKSRSYPRGKEEESSCVIA